MAFQETFPTLPRTVRQDGYGFLNYTYSEGGCMELLKYVLDIMHPTESLHLGQSLLSPARSQIGLSLLVM